VLGKFGWREYWLSNGKDILKINSKIAPIQSFLGVLGTTGLTAYVGLVLAVTGCTVTAGCTIGLICAW
jgi:NADPH-dependent curcumin reductase CurA